MKGTLADLPAEAASPCQARVAEMLKNAGLLQSQIQWRILKGEKIPHAEKLFSAFEPFTR